jgi:hypothetical protein
MFKSDNRGIAISNIEQGMMNVEGEQGDPDPGINFLLPAEIKHEVQNFVLIIKKNFGIRNSLFDIRYSNFIKRIDVEGVYKL